MDKNESSVDMAKTVILLALLLLPMSGWGLNFTIAGDSALFIDDAYLRSGQATTNYGTGSTATVGYNSTGTNTYHCPIRYNTLADSLAVYITGSYVYDSSTITFKLNAGNATTETTYVCLQTMRRAWVEDQTTWNVYSTGNNWATAGATDTTSDVFNDAPSTFMLTSGNTGSGVSFTVRCGTNFGSTYTSVLLKTSSYVGVTPVLGFYTSENTANAGPLLTVYYHLVEAPSGVVSYSHGPDGNAPAHGPDGNRQAHK